MSRTPIRDQFRRRPATPTTVARTTTAEGPKRNVALGLVPSQGQGASRRIPPSTLSSFRPHFAIRATHFVITALEGMPRTSIRGGNPGEGHRCSQ